MTQTAVGARVARHAAFALLGFILPLAIAVIALPIAARGLGPARFGLIGLAWAMVEYLGFFDLGLSRASVRFVAAARTQAPSDLRQIVAVAIATQAIAGVAAGFLASAASNALATRVFSVPVEIQGEAAAMFRMVALNVAVVIVMSGLRGVLEGAQRFDLSTALKVPAAAAAVLIPAVGAVLGASLPTIILAVFLARLGILAALFVAVTRALPGFGWEPPREWGRLRALLKYSGWVAVTSVATPFLVSMDRFALGALLGVAAVGFYVAPYEAATRLLLVPASMFAALFPMLTSTEASADRDRSLALIESAARQLALVVLPPVLLALVLAPELLTIWLGPTFAAQTATAVRILAFGVLVNALAHVPSVFLYAAGRPDLPAKLHVAETIFHVPLTIALVTKWGITGAATAWTLRVVVDAIVLVVFMRRVGGRRVILAGLHWTRALWLAVAYATFLVVVRVVGDDVPLATVIAGIVGLFVFAAVAWRAGFTASERASWLTLIRVRSAPASE